MNFIVSFFACITQSNCFRIFSKPFKIFGIRGKLTFFSYLVNFIALKKECLEDINENLTSYAYSYHNKLSKQCDRFNQKISWVMTHYLNKKIYYEKLYHAPVILKLTKTHRSLFSLVPTPTGSTTAP